MSDFLDLFGLVVTGALILVACAIFIFIPCWWLFQRRLGCFGVLWVIFAAALCAFLFVTGGAM